MTPYYNSGEIFRETVASVQSQSLQDWQWIVVDDGSTDASALRVLEDVAAGDSRVVVVHQHNAGPSAARNRGFAQTTGVFVCLLDSDDLLEPTFLEKCVWFLESHDQFGFCNSWSVNFGERQFLWSTGFETGARHLDANSGPPIAVLRRYVYQVSGGFDEGIRHGHEDWDFWLRIAGAGYWGNTIPEYLSWYRNRSAGRFVQFMADPLRHEAFCAALRQRHEGLANRFPAPSLREPAPYEPIRVTPPFRNELDRSDRGSVLFVLPWMVTGGADRVSIEWVAALKAGGYRVSVVATLAATHVWQHKYEEITPDVFALAAFLCPTDYPAFIDYLIGSRGIDAIVIAGSTIGYHSLPYLRARHPNIAVLDLCHVEEPHWLSGGHPRFAIGFQDLLDLNVVSTSHLKRWMVERGADPDRVAVCHTGADVAALSPLRDKRAEVRSTLGIDADCLVAIFGGRLSEQKRPALLPRIVKAARIPCDKLRLLVVGDGELRGEVAAQIAHADCHDAVMMLGTMPHDQWLNLLAASDVLLMPSDYEGISVALYEAMALGVVPLMSDVGALGEVVTPDVGCLVPKGDDEVGAFGAVIDRLFAEPARLQALSQAARDRIATSFPAEAGARAFIVAVERARSLAQRRGEPVLSARTGVELTTLGLEYFRLSNGAHFLWQHWLATRGGAVPGSRGNDLPFAHLDSSQTAAVIEIIDRFGHLLGNPRPRRIVVPMLGILNWMRTVARKSVDRLGRRGNDGTSRQRR